MAQAGPTGHHEGDSLRAGRRAATDSRAADTHAQPRPAAAAARGAKRLGLYRFGAAAHILTQICRWQERQVRSLTNLTRRDGEELLALAPAAEVRTHVTTYPLDQANVALADLRAGCFAGAAVLVP